MKYEDFEASFVTKNRFLTLALILSILLSSATLAIVVSKQRYFVINNAQVFKERPLAESVCLESFTSMAKGEPNESLITKGILAILEKSPFEIELSSVLKLKSTEELKCKLIIKSGKRLRSFVIGIVESDEYPFYYKLNELDEVAAKEES
jgi:hypothetical protein